MVIRPNYQPPAADVRALRDAGGKVRVWGVDVTNACNATCWYCPQPDHERARGFISEDTFAAVLDVASYPRFNLHFFSEPLLHPKLVELVAMATARGFQVGFSTNGVLLTQAKLDALGAAGLAWLRLHTNAHRHRGQPFGVRLSSFAIPAGMVATEHRVGSEDEALGDVWDKGMASQAGFVPGMAEGGGAKRCSYLGTDGGEPWRVVLWDGRFAMCCVDIEGKNDPALCSKCNGVVFTSPETVGDIDGSGGTPAGQGVL